MLVVEGTLENKFPPNWVDGVLNKFVWPNAEVVCPKGELLVCPKSEPLVCPKGELLVCPNAELVCPKYRGLS